jgi:hypothetical protein
MAPFTAADEARSAFAEHLREEILRPLAALPDEVREDLYVIALELVTEEPDERCVIATLSWNTTAHFVERQREVPEAERLDRGWNRFRFLEPAGRVIGGAGEDRECGFGVGGLRPSVCGIRMRTVIWR